MEIQDLKRELSMHYSLASRSRVAYEPYSDAQRAELTGKLMQFLDAEGDAPEMQLESVRLKTPRPEACAGGRRQCHARPSVLAAVRCGAPLARGSQSQ